MSSRFVNLALLVLLVAEFASGVVSYLMGTPSGQGVIWVHRIGGFAIVALLGWKIGIVVRSYRSRGLTLLSFAAALLGGLFLLSLAFGLLWSTTGVRGTEVPVLGSLTGLGLHVTFAVAFLPLLLLHVIVRWPRVRARRPDFASRRAVLRYGALSAIGLVLWRTSEMASQSADWTGSQRRFTGSREISSLSGNGFPATNWFSDPKPDIAPEAWSLRIYGEVHVETNLTITSLEAFAPATVRAPLDCTGGWFTDQVWTGYPVSALLLAAGASSDARSVVFHSVTGYARRYALDGAERLLLATRVGDEPLTRGHGYPLRLIAPGRRGFGWVKWVVAIEVSALPGWFQSPLPLQ